MNAQVFIAYTGRFEEIMQSFPGDTWTARFSISDTLPEPSKELSRSVLRYLNLCSEEFYLYKRGYLAREIWEIWRAELERMLRAPLFRREWQTLRSEFIDYPEFRTYVETVQTQLLKSTAR